MQRGTIFILFCVSAVVACAQLNPPRLRPSPYFGSITGLSYADVDELGKHNYDRMFGEKNPLVYTAKAGYIDIGHLRESADRARYLFDICHHNIRKGNKSFSYKVIEPAIYRVTLEYPNNWNQLSETDRQTIARTVAIDLGQHLAQQTTIWHEIITWYGYASTGLLSEHNSSFSWEDSYSDLLGTKLGAMALRKNSKAYDKAMTEIIEQELEKLDPQSESTAKKATKAIQGKWFTGRYPFMSMKKRNFDVGLDDHMVTPFRVPKIVADTEVLPCSVPQLESLAEHGFVMQLELTPKSKQRKQVLKIIYPDGSNKTLRPAEHFQTIIDHIRELAVEDVGDDVDSPTLD